MKQMHASEPSWVLPYDPFGETHVFSRNFGLFSRKICLFSEKMSLCMEDGLFSLVTNAHGCDQCTRVSQQARFFSRKMCLFSEKMSLRTEDGSLFT